MKIKVTKCTECPYMSDYNYPHGRYCRLVNKVRINNPNELPNECPLKKEHVIISIDE